MAIAVRARARRPRAGGPVRPPERADQGRARDRIAALEQHARAAAATDDVGEEPDVEPVDDVDGELDEDLEEQQAAETRPGGRWARTPATRAPGAGAAPAAAARARDGGGGPGKGRRLPDARAIRHANSRRFAVACGEPYGPAVGACVRRPPGSRPAIPDHHPHTAPDKPTPRQQRYLRQLAEQTGTSFTPPATMAEASREIKRLQGRARDPRADQVRDQRAVQADLQAGAGDSVRHGRGDTRGYGSSARWAHHGNDEGDR